MHEDPWHAGYLYSCDIELHYRIIECAHNVLHTVCITIAQSLHVYFSLRDIICSIYTLQDT